MDQGISKEKRQQSRVYRSITVRIVNWNMLSVGAIRCWLFMRLATSSLILLRKLQEKHPAGIAEDVGR